MDKIQNKKNGLKTLKKLDRERISDQYFGKWILYESTECNIVGEAERQRHHSIHQNNLSFNSKTAGPGRSTSFLTRVNHLRKRPSWARFQRVWFTGRTTPRARHEETAPFLLVQNNQTTQNNTTRSNEYGNM